MRPPADDDEPNNPYEDAPWRSIAEMLVEQGYAVLPSAAVSKYELRGRLWELLYAMAGKRIFFFHTDHLSDREFYLWLETQWMPGAAADLPPESEWNCHVDVSESGTANINGEKLALRYYADDATRANWQQEHPGQPLPPHQTLPFHRDRILPRPHSPILNDWPLPHFVMEEMAKFDQAADRLLDEVSEDSEEDEDGDDPLGLAAVDREIHRQNFHQDDDQSFRTMSSTGAPDPDPETEEQELVRPIDVLRERHYTPLPMAELTEETIAASLWELLHELCQMNFYIVHSDHLSDAELYVALTRHVLYLKVIVPELLETVACYHDCLQPGGQEQKEMWLAYYASVPQRREWASLVPHLPAKQARPYQRDWRLPQLPVRP